MAVDLAVVIVTWNVRALVLDALRSLYADLAQSRLTAEVYVVDSASSDDSVSAVAAEFPQVKLIASQNNLGFGAANNLALKQIGFGAESQELPKAVYLLNPDTITHLGATQTLYDALFSNERVGLVGANLTYGDGSFQHGAFGFPGLRQLWVEFFPTPGRHFESSFNGRYPRSAYQSEQRFPVDFVLGATMMLRREVIQQTGMFDEQFFMYCEEIDWAWRIHKAGWQVYTVPAAHVTHLGGQSTSQIRPQSLVNLWTSRLQLFDKHYSPFKRLIARAMVKWGMRLKKRQLQYIGLPEADRTAVAAAYQTIAEMASS
ncbi:MAG: glycosyltransferase family 2 protein [Chloroflexi bacterium]|nr:glycosyltransferase family 2 protein [Chloroflexota bacterium]MCC6896975.1 glycosyltransferase family 2 protein [Anaerolineae bacterium]